MGREQRGFTPEIRSVDGSNGRQFWAMPVAYEVVDDYGTIWTRGVFAESVEQRMPTLLYGHDWDNIGHVLGQAIDYREGDLGPETLFELTDFDEHPHTRQVAAQINDGSLRDMSVGFDRQVWDGPALGGRRSRVERPLADADRALGARERMREAGWDETSLVIRGAVPGSRVLTGVRSVRTAGGLVVDLDAAVALGRKIGAGEITHEDAAAALELLASDGTGEEMTEAAGDTVTGDGTGEALPEIDTDVTDAEAEALAVLEGLES